MVRFPDNNNIFASRSNNASTPPPASARRRQQQQQQQLLSNGRSNYNNNSNNNINDGSSSSTTHLVNNYTPATSARSRLRRSASSSSLIGSLPPPHYFGNNNTMDASASSLPSPPPPPLSLKEFVWRELSALILWVAVAIGTWSVMRTCFFFSTVVNMHLVLWSFYNPLLLVWIQQKTGGVLPLWQVRVAEWRMGRLATIEFVLSLGIHLLVGTVLLLYLLPMYVSFLFEGDSDIGFSLSWININNNSNDSNNNIQVAAILAALQGTSTPTSKTQLDTEGSSSSFQGGVAGALSDILMTSCFLVALLVLPVLLDLNQIPRWSLLVIFYPLVPLGSSSSSFHPVLLSANVLLHAWTTIRTRSYCFLLQRRVIAQFVGALLAGEIMEFFFPDDPKT